MKVKIFTISDAFNAKEKSETEQIINAFLSNVKVCFLTQSSVAIKDDGQESPVVTICIWYERLEQLEKQTADVPAVNGRVH